MDVKHALKIKPAANIGGYKKRRGVKYYKYILKKA